MGLNIVFPVIDKVTKAMCIIVNHIRGLWHIHLGNFVRLMGEVKGEG